MRLRVATFNVWALPEPIASDVAPRMRAIAAKLRTLDADVVALQEVWTPGARSRLVRGGRDAGFEHAWPLDTGFATAGGLLVLSRLPIEEPAFEPFAVRGHPERFEQGEYWGRKGFVRLRVESDGGPVTLVDTHLHAHYHFGAPHRYRPHRVAQLSQVMAWVLGSSDPVVLAGDLNFEEGDPEYRVLRGVADLRDVAAELDLRRPTVIDTSVYRQGGGAPSRRIDFVFVGDGATRRVVPRAVRCVFDGEIGIGGRTAACSDHVGVLAELELVEAPAAAARGPDPAAVELALGLLAEGRADALDRAREYRTVALAGAGTLGLAATGARLASSRRRFLRRAFYAVGFLALGPGASSGVLSEHYAPEEERAFEQAAARLAALRPRAASA